MSKQTKDHTDINIPGTDTLTVLDAETLVLEKRVKDANLMKAPVSVETAGDTAYIGCAGAAPAIVSLELDDLVLTGSGASLSRPPEGLMHCQENQTLYFTDESGLFYLFDDTCLRIKTRTGQNVWTSALEVLVSPEET